MDTQAASVVKLPNKNREILETVWEMTIALYPQTYQVNPKARASLKSAFLSGVQLGLEQDKEKFRAAVEGSIEDLRKEIEKFNRQ